nr:MAG TPA: hypothetical protein [Caudoviricetes sp.]
MKDSLERLLYESGDNILAATVNVKENLKNRGG